MVDKIYAQDSIRDDLGLPGRAIAAEVSGDGFNLLVQEEGDAMPSSTLQPAPEYLKEDTLSLHADQIQRVFDVISREATADSNTLSAEEKKTIRDQKNKGGKVSNRSAFNVIRSLTPPSLQALSKLKLTSDEAASLKDVQALLHAQRIATGLLNPTANPYTPNQKNIYASPSTLKVIPIYGHQAAKFEMAQYGTDPEAAFDPYNINNITNGRPTHHYIDIKVQSALTPNPENGDHPSGYVLTVTEVPDNGRDSVRVKNSEKNVKTITVTAEDETKESKKNTGTNVAAAYAKHGIVLSLDPGMAPRPR